MKLLLSSLALGALTLTSYAQQFGHQSYNGGYRGGDVTAPYYATRAFNYFIGGSVGHAEHGDDVSDSLHGDTLFTFELGAKYDFNSALYGVLSFEFIGSGDSFTGVDSEGDLADVDATSLGVFFNAKVGVKFNRYVSGYVGVGVGVNSAYIEADFADGFSRDNTESVFGYQFMAGVELKPFGDQFGLYLQYRNLNGEDVSGTNFTPFNDDFYEVGARFYF